MALHIDTSLVRDIAVCRCVGRITQHDNTASQLRTHVTEILRQGAIHILLSWAGITYVDSTGLGELVACFTLTRNSGGELVFANLSARAFDLFRVTKIEKVFKSFDTEEAALEYLSQQSTLGSRP